MKTKKNFRERKKLGFLKKRNRKFIAFILLFSLVVCLIYRDYRTADAMATPLDIMGSAIMELSMYLAGVAAGEKQSDVIQKNPYISNDNSVTNNDARSNYVTECFPESVFC